MKTIWVEGVLCVAICVAGCGSRSEHHRRVEAAFQQRQKSYDVAVSRVESYERLCIVLSKQVSDVAAGEALQDALFDLNRCRYARGQAAARLDRAKRYWDNIRDAGGINP